MAKPSKKFLAYDKAILNLKRAGLSKVMSKAASDPKILAAVKKIGKGGGTVADWSCCVGFDDPIGKPGNSIVNPPR